jgi:hypothetical protein
MPTNRRSPFVTRSLSARKRGYLSLTNQNRFWTLVATDSQVSREGKDPSGWGPCFFVGPVLELETRR